MALFKVQIYQAGKEPRWLWKGLPRTKPQIFPTRRTARYAGEKFVRDRDFVAFEVKIHKPSDTSS